MRAFIFSLDAFVAFTLALIAIYSLIFFSSIPSSYYVLLTQGHLLTKDILYSVSTSHGDAVLASNKDNTIMEYIVFSKSSSQSFQQSAIQATVGKMVPAPFEYKFETSEDNGKTWKLVYASTTKSPQKLSVSSQSVAFSYSSFYNLTSSKSSPYGYNTCNGGGSGAPHIITCDSLSVDINQVPPVSVKLVRLTLFI